MTQTASLFLYIRSNFYERLVESLTYRICRFHLTSRVVDGSIKVHIQHIGETPFSSVWAPIHLQSCYLDQLKHLKLLWSLQPSLLCSAIWKVRLVHGVRSLPGMEGESDYVPEVHREKASDFSVLLYNLGEEFVFCRLKFVSNLICFMGLLCASKETKTCDDSDIFL